LVLANFRNYVEIYLMCFINSFFRNFCRSSDNKNPSQLSILKVYIPVVIPVGFGVLAWCAPPALLLWWAGRDPFDIHSDP
jgi:hypothetical protein